MEASVKQVFKERRESSRCDLVASGLVNGSSLRDLVASGLVNESSRCDLVTANEVKDSKINKTIIPKPLAFNIFSLRPITIEYTTGITTKVKKVAVIKPPITTVANGR